MDYKHPSGIVVLEGLEAVRRRPAMYIGADEPARSMRAGLLEALLDAAVRDTPPPEEIRVLLWRNADITLAHDGAPLPIEPSGAPNDGVSHPALYRSFMELRGPYGLAYFGAILNALSDRLIVSTMHDGHRYRAVFSKGMLMTLLGRTHCSQPLGVTWLTFRPDPAIITGEPLTISEARRIAERMERKAGGVRIRVEDRSGEDADWY